MTDETTLEDPGTNLDWSDPAFREELRRFAEHRRMPALAVLDTCFVRSGLRRQILYGGAPPSLTAIREGLILPFMAGDTVIEILEKLPLFAEQLGTTTSALEQLFVDEWLEHVRIVDLPSALREIDDRALAVQNLDADDYPAAALAALLSPCMILTNDFRHFSPLGVRDSFQAMASVVAVIEVRVGERELHTVTMIPVVPVMAIGAGIKWTSDRIGPFAWLLAGILMAGGLAAYRHQSPERKQSIKHAAGQVGTYLLETYADATATVHHAQRRLSAHLVPAPATRSMEASIIRELAQTSQSLSAQQLHDALADPPSTSSIREFLRANKDSVFFEERRGGFSLGVSYDLRVQFMI